MLTKVKTAMRITTDAFDGELTGLINAALRDLAIAGIAGCDPTTSDALIVRAVITYCKAHFGQAETAEYDRIKASYDEQKAQLQTATGYGLDETMGHMQSGVSIDATGQVWGAITQRD